MHYQENCVVREEGRKVLQQKVSPVVAAVVIVLVVLLAAVLFWLAGRPKGVTVPEGFKPMPPQFKFKGQ